jgi:uncharacterized damage-inducible protein DinB
MTTVEILLEDFEPEMANTRRMLERVPDGNPDFRCHDKSMSLGGLAMHVATLPAFGSAILTTPSIDMTDPSHKFPDQTFRSKDATLTAFDAAASDVRAALLACSDEELAEPWKLSYGAHVIFHGPKSAAYRIMFVNHLIHHRAQLGVYLRLIDIPVPGMYGPSADEAIGTGK